LSQTPDTTWAGTFRGTFGDFDAAVADGVLNGAAKVASRQVKDANLAAHLQGPDFFDAQAHPDLTFASTAITATAIASRSTARSPSRAHPDGRAASRPSPNEVTIVAELQLAKQA
jgi:hypothetical protein